jgi:hypothetical protein
MVFLSHLSINVMILPRQARDKHRESSTQKRELRFVLLQGWLYAPVNGNLIYANQGVQWAGQQMAAEGDLVGMLLVGKPSFFSPFSFIKICIRIHFAKTGSGQPAGKLENQRLFPPGPGCWHAVRVSERPEAWCNGTRPRLAGIYTLMKRTF